MAVVSKELLYPHLTWEMLYFSHGACPVPFTLPLADGSFFYAEEVIRLVPTKRLIAYGSWEGKLVFAKLFFHPKRAIKHLEQEIENIKMLKIKDILTPAIYFYGFSQSKKIKIVLFERILQLNNLPNYRNQILPKHFFNQLLEVIKLIAQQHNAGILQNDIHLNNFLLTAEKIYTIDGAKMDFFPEPISQNASINNLAWFLYDFGPWIQSHLEKIFSVYAAERQWIIEDTDKQFLEKQIKIIRKDRWQRLLEKMYRGSSDFFPIRLLGRRGVCHRKAINTDLMRFIKQPDDILKNAILLKKNYFLKTYQINLNNNVYIVKCYNKKSIFHSSQAAKIWRITHQLDFFGMPMPKPIAFFEKKFAGVCTHSYVILERQ